jgi:putative ABC transport system permease protein
MLVLCRLAWREIRNHARFSLFFASNLALGFAGFVALDAFEASVTRALVERSRAYLGADVVVSSSRPVTPTETQTLDRTAGPDAQIAHAVVLFSMAGTGEHARLVELRAIDAAYPLYGSIELEQTSAAPHAGDARAALRDGPGAWIDPPLLAQLGVALGDVLQIGRVSFHLQGLVARDGGRATSGFALAPRIYVDLAQLDATGLVATGSRVEYQRLYRLAGAARPDDVARAMRVAVDDPRVTARSHDEATRDLARSYAAVSRYLGLVALVAVFLAGLGAAHLFRAHLARRVSDLAILVSLGATRTRAQAIFALQLAMLGLCAAVGAVALGLLLLPALTAVAGDAVPPGFAPRIGVRTAATVALLAVFGSAAACLPLVVRLRRLRPAQLFAEQATPSLASAPRDAVWWVPAGIGFWAIACWRVDSFAIGSVFTGLFGAAALLLGGFALALTAVFAAAPRAASLPVRLALRELSRSRLRTVSGFVSLGLCALLVSLVPQLRSVLDRDLETPRGAALPSLFLFDIQPEQRDALSEYVVARGTSLQRLSPLVRARLDRIDGKPATAMEEGDAEDARRLRSRRYNLTWRRELNDSERMLAGRPFSGSWDPRSGRPPNSRSRSTSPSGSASGSATRSRSTCKVWSSKAKS